MSIVSLFPFTYSYLRSRRLTRSRPVLSDIKNKRLFISIHYYLFIFTQQWLIVPMNKGRVRRRGHFYVIHIQLPLPVDTSLSFLSNFSTTRVDDPRGLYCNKSFEKEKMDGDRTLYSRVYEEILGSCPFSFWSGVKAKMKTRDEKTTIVLYCGGGTRQERDRYTRVRVQGISRPVVSVPTSSSLSVSFQKVSVV